MSNVLLEIVVNTGDAAACGIESRDQIEDPLGVALASGVGEVTGGGGGSGVFILDVEVASEDAFCAT